MKKILVVTTRSPFPPVGGDKLRIYEIIKNLKKKNIVDVFYCDHNTDSGLDNGKALKNVYSHNLKIYQRIFNSFLKIIQLKPIQTGYFLSSTMKKLIEKKCNNYDTIIFHLIRSCEYLPKNFSGKIILEMTDLISKNYFLSFKKINYLNPLKYLYLLEALLLKNYEMKMIKKFDSTVFVSKNEINLINNKYKRKIFFINNGIKNYKSPINFSKKRNEIIFFGNINSFPNRDACIKFIKKVFIYLPKNKGLKFKIIGNINVSLKSNFSKYQNVIVTGKVKNLREVSKNALCGICNVEVATGLQNKILEYMSIGLPSIISEISFNDEISKRNTTSLVYKNYKDLENKIFKLMSDTKLHKKLSIDAFKFSKKFKWNKTLKNYSKLI